jgi:exopolyphosphatase/guanosine-5'-triphosphate,3'-diphosphate pyrophosphatase
MRIAAIDVGSNSVHMIVCRIRPDLSFEMIDREKDMIRLGAAGLDGKELTASAVAAAMQTLSKFKRLAESHGVDEIIAAATSAVRESENGGDFIAAVRREVGIRVQVISGSEEARLIHLAAAYAVGVGRRRSIVIDIGGGSTEITLGTAARVEQARSFRLGALRLTDKFGQSDPLSAKDERRLVRHIRRDAGAYLKSLVERGYHRVIGSSGTMLSLGALAAGRRAADDVRNLRVSAKDFSKLRKRMTGLRLDERLQLPGLDPRRADLASVGVVLIDTLLGALKAKEFTLCDFALREGLILDYVRKNAAHIRKAERYPDVRRRSVVELGERCAYWASHADVVAKLALQTFDATQDKHGLGPREREWLEYGALLHDIGHHISYERHHKHSYYLIKHGGLRGFEPEEIEIIGLVARYHRQGTPRKSHEGFKDLSKDRRATVRLLGAMVRLAEGLERSHGQVISRLAFTTNDTGLLIRLHAQDNADLELWAAQRHAAALADLLDTPIQFELAPRSGRSRKARAARKTRQTRKTRKTRTPSPGRDPIETAPTPPAAASGPTPEAPSEHAEHAGHQTRLPRAPVRRGGDRRVGQDDPAGPAGHVAGRERPPGVRH